MIPHQILPWKFYCKMNTWSTINITVATEAARLTDNEKLKFGRESVFVLFLCHQSLRHGFGNLWYMEGLLWGKGVLRVMVWREGQSWRVETQLEFSISLIPQELWSEQHHRGKGLALCHPASHYHRLRDVRVGRLGPLLSGPEQNSRKETVVIHCHELSPKLGEGTRPGNGDTGRAPITSSTSF